MKYKNVLLCLVIMLLQMISFEIYSQSGNAKSLEIGNKWVYKNWIQYYEGDEVYYYYSTKEVIKDTIIDNQSYAVIQNIQDSLSLFEFERADSMQIYTYSTYYNSEYVIVNFAQRDTFIEKDDLIIYSDTINFWGKDRVQIIQETGPLHIGYGITYYIEGIGLENYYYKFHGGGSRGQYIVAAYLNGIKYGDTTLVDVKMKEQIPNDYELFQNYPNPFNPTTKINYQLQVPGWVILKVYDILGKEIVTLVNAEKTTGKYELEFNAGKYKLSSGIYFVKMEVFENNSIIYSSTKKLMLIK